MSTKKTQSETICLQQDGGAVMLEGIAKSAISPGHMIEIMVTPVADIGKLQVQKTAGSDARRAYAVEDRHSGKSVDDAYAANARVSYVVVKPGHRVMARLAAAAGAIVTGDFLTPHSDGTVKKAGGTDTRTAVAKQTVDNSAGAAEVFIRVESM